jgi:hypothetical protein
MKTRDLTSKDGDLRQFNNEENMGIRPKDKSQIDGI